VNTYRLQHIAVTASTNDEVKRAAESGEPEGYAVQALRQTAGRGRHGRHWESPEGNLYCSILLRPFVARPLGTYSLMASLAIADMIQNVLPQAALALKWPNDVLLNGKKVSGILIEAGEGWLVIGMGVNIVQYPADTLYPATALAEAGLRDRDLAALTIDLLDGLWGWYQRLQAQGFAPIQQAWLALALQGEISVKLPQRIVRGQFAGLGPDGSLRLRLADGSERSIASGDVFHHD